MKDITGRRKFIKTTAIAGVGIGVSKNIKAASSVSVVAKKEIVLNASKPDLPFIPRRVASWWNTIEDLQWSQKSIKDKVKRRAEAFANAKIDTAMNYGFHIRFDFANYFQQLHEYFAAVKEELHKYDIKFIEHYSCNHVERPKNRDDFERLHRTQRHHTLLFHDPKASEHAQYEGHKFQDICEVDIIDGSRGYSKQYFMEAFCHNNPGFLDMHKKYLLRLIQDVDFDGYEIDDMCDYVGLRACGCKYCRDRFKKDYGREIPPITDKNFWGDMTKPMLQWGNYKNPVFRDWIAMKDDVIADHVKMVKEVIGNKPLLTCCSSTGPIRLNAISLNLERVADDLDFFMLENVGINTRSVDWVKTDAEALQQKDIAMKRGNCPPIALSYTIYKDGGYLGWALARFWGVANWASTMNKRLVEDPVDALEEQDVIGPSNNWEAENSNLDFYEGKDIVEVRLVYNYYCRMNGWTDDDGKEQWDKVLQWSKAMVENNVGYRFVRYKELASAEELMKERTPLILDGVACLSDAQYTAIEKYLRSGGVAWLALPFGTHDEKGFVREKPLSEKLFTRKYKNLKIVETATKENSFQKLVKEKAFTPAIKHLAGDEGWAIRLRKYNGKPVIHFLNRKMQAKPHATIKDMSGTPVVTTIDSKITDNKIKFEIDKATFNFSGLKLYSPELNNTAREIVVSNKGNKLEVSIDLTKIKIYAVAQ